MQRLLGGGEFEFMSKTRRRMTEYWALGKRDEWWTSLLVGVGCLGLLLLLFTVPVLVVAFLWSYRIGSAMPVNFTLRAMFWVGIVSAGSIAASCLLSFWADLARARRCEKGGSLTLQEILEENLDFERWCL